MPVNALNILFYSYCILIYYGVICLLDFFFLSFIFVCFELSVSSIRVVKPVLHVGHRWSFWDRNRCTYDHFFRHWWQNM